MGDPRGFLKVARAKGKYLPVVDRLKNYKEFSIEPSEAELREQASRCMDCGIPFCHQGCPLGNLIPEFNDLTFRGNRDEALARLLETNDFPEVTGRVCPAPCEATCVLNLGKEPVTIKAVERHLASALPLAPLPRQTLPTPKRVAIVGSGPAGLSAARRLAVLGYSVTVFERDDRIGGLLRYGIPDFKLEKHLLDLRQAQLEGEGVVFRTSTSPTADELRAFDATVLAMGARVPRPLQIPGHDLAGVHYAMAFLDAQNRAVAAGLGHAPEPWNVHGKHVVVLGGGDTGADCVGVANRHGAAKITQLELMPAPPVDRATADLWPAWPNIFRTSTSHEEGGERLFGVRTTRLLADASGTRLRALEGVRVEYTNGAFVDVPGSTFTLEADFLFVATGFVSVEKQGITASLGVAVDSRGRIETDALTGETSVRNVYAAGDASRGASLVVWALADGRRIAAALHERLSSSL